MTFPESLDAFYDRFGPQSAIASEVSYPAKLVFLERQFGLYASWLKESVEDRLKHHPRCKQYAKRAEDCNCNKK